MIATIEQAAQRIDAEWKRLAASWTRDVAPGGYLPITNPEVAAEMQALAERSSASSSPS